MYFQHDIMESIGTKKESESERNERNKFVRTKMRLKLGTEIDLPERFVRFVRWILSDFVFQ